MYTINSKDSRAPFIETKEYRRFSEFCDACRREKYIGLCYGSPGVGKTASARHYAQWDVIDFDFEDEESESSLLDFTSSDTIFYTASVTNSPRRLEEDLKETIYTFLENRREIKKAHNSFDLKEASPKIQLIIVDEADRLKAATLEHLRDLYDRENFGLVLIGMMGMEKRLSRYAQLYSRVGFAHHYRLLSKEEMYFILTKHWQKLGLKLNLDDFTDNEAMAAIFRVTNGNFRVTHRLFKQIERIMKINNLKSLTAEVVDAARECLVIGKV